MQWEKPKCTVTYKVELVASGTGIQGELSQSEK